MIYSTGSHTKFYHRFHVVWTTKHRYKVMRGEMRERIREIIIQTCQELGVHIEKGVLSTDHVHMFISVPPQVALSKVMMRIKGRSSYKIQREFPELRKRYWGQRFWAHGFFSKTSGNVTDAVILQYLELLPKGNLPASAGSRSVPTMYSRGDVKLSLRNVPRTLVPNP
jgi:putative transposase